MVIPLLEKRYKDYKLRGNDENGHSLLINEREGNYGKKEK